MSRRLLVVASGRARTAKLREALERAGHEVQVTSNAQTAVEQASSAPPDLVVTDAVLSGMTGFDLCKALKSSPGTAQVPVVIVTGCGSADILRGLTSGADNLIIEPVRWSDPAERLERIFASLDCADRSQVDTPALLSNGSPPVTVTVDKRQMVELLLATADQLASTSDQLEGLGQALDRALVELRESERRLQHVVDDNRKLRRARDEAERANRAKSEFLSRMSREARAPLTSILAFARLLEMDGLTSEQRRRVEQILTAGRHVLDLVDDVLDITRFEAGGRLAQATEDVPADAAVDEAVRPVRLTES